MVRGTSASSEVRRSFPALVFTSLRPEQWTKNFFVFAALLFGQQLGNAAAIVRAFAIFVVFCALSGVVYLVNDIADREADRAHPRKRFRPLASGELQPKAAAAFAVGLLLASLGTAWWLSPRLAGIGLAYATLLILYSFALKHIVLLDVLAIAAGFVLRAAAGAVAVGVPISEWLLICTTLLALFLALSKRRHELTLLDDGASGHRPILQEYTPYLLDQLIGVVTASTLVAYCIYTISPETAARLGTTRLSITIPFVLYGIFRYLYLVHRKSEGGNPSTLLVSDRPLIACVGLWSLSVALVLYSPLGR